MNFAHGCRPLDLNKYNLCKAAKKIVSEMTRHQRIANVNFGMNVAVRIVDRGGAIQRWDFIDEEWAYEFATYIAMKYYIDEM